MKAFFLRLLFLLCPIFTYSQADLVIINGKPLLNSAAKGGILYFDITIQNIGTQVAPPSSVALYLSTISNITINSVPLKFYHTKRLAPLER